MDVLTLSVLAALAVGLVLLAVFLFRLRQDIASLRDPEQSSGLLLLHNQLEALREQVRSSLEGGRLEIDRRLEQTNRVVGQVRQGLGEVDRQVRSVTEAARDLRGLQELLRSPKLRGGMGEYLLAELLAQVLPQSSFSLQYAFPGGERVDAVIRLGNRMVPIDAKFPLENFRRASRAAEGEDATRARRSFAADVRKHIDDIATRYVRPGHGTYDFAMMYIPAEGVYREALLRDDDQAQALFDYALSRRVIPVSPQSFYAYLQVIVLGLRGLSIEERAEEILRRLGLIRTRLDSFTESFDVATRHLGNAVRQVDEARRRLDRLDAALVELGEAPETEAETAVNPAGDSGRGNSAGNSGTGY